MNKRINKELIMSGAVLRLADWVKLYFNFKHDYDVKHNCSSLTGKVSGSVEFYVYDVGRVELHLVNMFKVNRIDFHSSKPLDMISGWIRGLEEINPCKRYKPFDCEVEVNAFFTEHLFLYQDDARHENEDTEENEDADVPNDIDIENLNF